MDERKETTQLCSGCVEILDPLGLHIYDPTEINDEEARHA